MKTDVIAWTIVNTLREWLDARDALRNTPNDPASRDTAVRDEFAAERRFRAVLAEFFGEPLP